MPATPGRWYNPNRSGTAWDLLYTLNSRMFAIWYTYDRQGNPVWLLSDTLDINTATNTWKSPLWKYTWNTSTGQRNPGVRVGSVAVAYFDNDPTRAAISWQWDEVDTATRTECIKDYFRDGATPNAQRGANATFTGLWYEPAAIEAWGLSLSIGQTRQQGNAPSKYLEFHAFTLYDQGGRPTWVLAQDSENGTAPALNTAKTIPLSYYRAKPSAYPQGVPINDCTVNCTNASPNIGSFERLFTTTQNGSAYVNVSASAAQLSSQYGLQFVRGSSGTGRTPIQKLNQADAIVVDRLQCTVPAGLSTCPITVNWGTASDATAATVYRRNVATGAMTQIFDDATSQAQTIGEHVENVGAGARYQFQMYVTRNGINSLASITPEVAGYAAPIDVAPPASTAACGTGTAPAIDEGSTPTTPGRWWNQKRVGTSWDLFYTPDNQGLYAIWYTFDRNRNPVWLVSNTNQVDRTNNVWASSLYRYTWNSVANTLNSPAVRVGSVALRFQADDPTRAALTWQWDEVDGTARTECITDYYRPGSTPVAARAVNSTYSGAWYEPARSGWGLNVSIGQTTQNDNTPSKYYEFDALSVYDTAGRPAWAIAFDTASTSAPPQDTKSFPTLKYYTAGAGYPSGVPINDCTTNCTVETANAGSLTRTFTTATTGTATVNVTATVNGRTLAWRRPDSGSGTVAIVKATQSNAILVDRLRCEVPNSATTCPVSVNWGSSDANARPFRVNVATGAVTSIGATKDGEYVDNLAVGAKVRYELRLSVSNGYLYSKTPDVVATAAPVVVVADQTIESLAGELPAHEPTVRAVSGQAGTSGGAATYEIPLVLPPGRRGMEPKLSLTYSSRSGNGLFGMGWSLSGLSSIHRCPSTPEQDGKVQAVQFTADDRLCLDGQRLVLKTGTYNVAGSTYATELDSFSRITLLGDNAGPTSYFKVETKGGETHYYGSESTAVHTARVTPTDAPAPVTWMLVTRSDSVGNNVRYLYRANGNGEATPYRVVWTGAGSGMGDRIATFWVENRPGTGGGAGNDNSSSYVAGGLTRQAYRVWWITLHAAGENLGSYRFEYGAPSAHSGRTLLRSVQHCPIAGGVEVCTPATTISWQETAPNYQLAPLTVPAELLGSVTPVDSDGDGQPDENNTDHRSPRFAPTADFNGDGTRDAIWTVPATTTTGTATTYLVLLGPNRSVLRYFAVPSTAYLLVANDTTADYNNDGRIDLTGRDTATGRLFVKVWTGPENATTFDQAYATTIDTAISASVGGLHHAGDMNGDGRADLVVREDVPGGPATCKRKAKIHLNTGSGASVGSIGFGLPTEVCLAERVNLGIASLESVDRVADFDADGLPDLWINGSAQEPDGPIALNRILFGTRNGGYSLTAKPIASLFPATDPANGLELDARLYRMWMDVNGDGLDDFVYIRLASASTPKWTLRLNTGKGLGNRILLDSGAGIGPCGRGTTSVCNDGFWVPRYASFMSPFDHDSDGRPEILFPARFVVQVCDRIVVYSGSEECPLPPGADPVVLGNASTQNTVCSEYYTCPEDPGTNQLQPIGLFGSDENPRDGSIDDVNGDGAITVADGHSHEYRPLYGNDSGQDRSLYYMNALQFVETAKDTFTVRVVPTTIIRGQGSSAEDVHGDGLTDGTLFGGCPSPNAMNCNVPLFSPQNVRFSWITSPVPQLPNGDPLMKRQPYVVENKGTGTNPDGKTAKLPDLVESITDGLGQASVWTYYPLSTTAGRSAGETPLYSMPPWSARYTDDRHVYFQSSMPVVAEMAVSNGIGGYRSVQYGYAEAMYNHQGRGMQGFRTVIEEDEESRVRTTTTFHQKFPLTGRADEVFVNSMNRTGTNAPFRKEKHHWRCNHADRSDTTCAPSIGTPVVKFPYLDATEAWTYDAATAELASGTPEEIAYQRTENVYRFGFACNTYVPTGASGFDAYGNQTGSIELVCDRGTKTYLTFQRTNKQFTFAPVVDTATWWPDKLTNEMALSLSNYSTAHALPAGVSSTSVTVFKTWAWNADRTLASEVTQNGTDGTTVTSAYGYPSPSYGLPNTVTLTASNDPSGAGPRTTTTTYSADGYFPASVTNPMGHVTQVTTRARDGQPSLAIDANGLRTTFQYDAFGAPLRVQYRGATDSATRMPDEAMALSNCPAGSCAPNARYKITKVQDGAPTTVKHFDLLGRAVRTESRLLDGTFSRVDTTYDSRGLVTQTTEPYRAGSTAYGTSFSGHDVLGRPRVKITQKGLDSYGDLRTDYTYVGRETRIRVCGTIGSKCLNNIARLTDAMGRYVETTDAIGGVTKYWYDGSGQALALRDANSSVTSATYNSFGQRLTLSDPNMGGWTFTYNTFGEVLSQRDARGITTTYAYDRLGRRTSKSATYDIPNVGTASDTVLDTWSYDAPNARGAPYIVRRTVNAATEREETFEYDVLARPVKTTTKQNTGSGVVSDFVSKTAFDGYYGRPKQMDYPNGERVAMRYSKYGHPLQEFDAQTSNEYRKVNAVDGRGQVTDETLGGLRTDGQPTIRSVYAYTGSTGQLTNVTHSKPGATLRSLTYTYDVFGNAVQQNLNNQAFEAFTYDALHRLTSAGRAGSVSGSVSYGYDAVGNFTYKSDFSQAATGAYSYTGSCGGGPNAVKSVTLAGGGTRAYCYDANGNLKSDNAPQALAIDYDHDNLPIRIVRGTTSSLLAYGANGERVRQGGTDGTRLYFGAYERVTTAGAEDKVYLGDYGVITTGGTRRVDYLLKDRLGSIDTIVDSTGNVKENRAYDPFGKPRLGTWADATPAQMASIANTARGFTQHEHLNAVQLIHMNGRSFDYNLGRFLSVDPIIQFPTNSQSLNPYSYILNNPLAGTDPTGYCAADVGTRIKECVNVFATFSDGSREDLGSYNLKSKNSVQLAKNVMLPGAESGAYRNASITVREPQGEVTVGKLTRAGVNQEGTTPDTPLVGLAKGSFDTLLTDSPLGLAFGLPPYFKGSNSNEGQLMYDLAPAVGIAAGGGFGLLRSPNRIASAVDDVADDAATLVPQITRNKNIGDAARDAIAAARPGSKVEQNFLVTGGWRRVDILDGRTAIESKVGRTSLSEVVIQELARDVKLLRSGQVDAVEWHFSLSPTTGRGGPTGPLREKLEKLGITIVEY